MKHKIPTDIYVHPDSGKACRIDPKGSGVVVVDPARLLESPEVKRQISAAKRLFDILRSQGHRIQSFSTGDTE